MVCPIPPGLPWSGSVRFDSAQVTMSAQAQTDDESTTNCWDADPPRQEVGQFGEPVAKEQIGEKYYEAYSGDRHELLFVAKYEWQGDSWSKIGLDRHELSSLFNAEGWPTE